MLFDTDTAPLLPRAELWVVFSSQIFYRFQIGSFICLASRLSTYLPCLPFPTPESFNALKTMRHIVPSASLSAVLAASQTFLSSNVAATEVALSYEVESQHQGISLSTSPEECFYAKKSYLRENAVDAGILQVCSDPGYVCVEDATSSLGGICIFDEVVERELQITCTKCTPASACAGLTPQFIANNIGEGSCCGAQACQGITGALF